MAKANRGGANLAFDVGAQSLLGFSWILDDLNNLRVDGQSRLSGTQS